MEPGVKGPTPSIDSADSRLLRVVSHADEIIVWHHMIFVLTGGLETQKIFSESAHASPRQHAASFSEEGVIR